MLNYKRLVAMARKWRHEAALGRRRLTLTRSSSRAKSSASTTSVADKGHFVVYTVDGKRFEVPLAYLNSSIFVELFTLSEDEFGFPGDGPITMPCDSAFMENVLSLLRRGVGKDVESKLISSMFASRCFSSSLYQAHHSQQLLLCGF